MHLTKIAICLELLLISDPVMDASESGLKFEGRGKNSAMEIYRAFMEDHEQLFRENTRILDCGAGSGIFSLLSVEKFGVASAYAYDGYYLNFLEILENIRKNSLFKVVADDHHIMGETERFTVNLKDGIVNKAGYGSRILVEARKVDDLILPEIDLMKITVPGAALEILQGAEDRIRTDHPAMIVEVLSRNEARAITRLLDGLDLKLDSTSEFARIENTDGNLLFFTRK